MLEAAVSRTELEASFCCLLYFTLTLSKKLVNGLKCSCLSTHYIYFS